MLHLQWISMYFGEEFLIKIYYSIQTETCGFIHFGFSLLLTAFRIACKERTCERRVNFIWIEYCDVVCRHCEWLINYARRFRSAHKLVWQTIVYSVTYSCSHIHLYIVFAVWVCFCVSRNWFKTVIHFAAKGSICFCLQNNNITSVHSTNALAISYVLYCI